MQEESEEDGHVDEPATTEAAEAPSPVAPAPVAPVPVPVAPQAAAPIEPPLPAAAASVAPVLPTRHVYDWYQSATHVTVSILAKAAIPESSEVNIRESSVCMRAYGGLLCPHACAAVALASCPVHSSRVRMPYGSSVCWPLLAVRTVLAFLRLRCFAVDVLLHC